MKIKTSELTILSLCSYPDTPKKGICSLIAPLELLSGQQWKTEVALGSSRVWICATEYGVK